MTDLMVLDASVAVDLVVGAQRSRVAARTIAGRRLAAPGLTDLEVVSALARLERTGAVGADAAREALALWEELPVERVPIAPLVKVAWGLRHSLWVADAFYIALAMALDCPLVTSDARLARAPHAGVTVTQVA
jgi:predicted nucleic acid-binding protein